MTGRRDRKRYARGSIGGREFAHILFYHRDQADFRSAAIKVTSSCLCKKAEGVVLPLLVESVKDGIEDSLHALQVSE